MLKLDVRASLMDLSADLRGLRRVQIPFATSLAVTQLAREIAAAETTGLAETLDNPTPFTLRAFGVVAARKSNLTAWVYAKDIQATYLAPFAFGGTQVLGKKRAILTPRDLATNAYGNIPRGRLASLKGRKDVFIGEVKTKSGMIGGVWQRVPGLKIGKRVRGRKQLRAPGRLKLLVQFTRPATVTRDLHYEDRARRVLDHRLTPIWQAALAKALATAR